MMAGAFANVSYGAVRGRIHHVSTDVGHLRIFAS
jgi:hypothetical protein